MEVNEMLGFVIAVIGIVLLGFFGVKLYGFFVDSEMKNAQAFIDDLTGKVQTLKDGESNSFALRGVEGWVLFAWNKETSVALDGEVIDKNRRPQKCFDNSCLCICEGSIEKCQEAGYCRAIDRNISLIGKTNYTSGNGDTGYSAKLISYCIPNSNQLMPFMVEKNPLNIKITLDYGQQISEGVSGEKNLVLDRLLTCKSTEEIIQYF